MTLIHRCKVSSGINELTYARIGLKSMNTISVKIRNLESDFNLSPALEGKKFIKITNISVVDKFYLISASLVYKDATASYKIYLFLLDIESETSQPFTGDIITDVLQSSADHMTFVGAQLSSDTP